MEVAGQPSASAATPSMQLKPRPTVLFAVPRTHPRLALMWVEGGGRRGQHSQPNPPCRQWWLVPAGGVRKGSGVAPAGVRRPAAFVAVPSCGAPVPKDGLWRLRSTYGPLSSRRFRRSSIGCAGGVPVTAGPPGRRRCARLTAGGAGRESADPAQGQAGRRRAPARRPQLRGQGPAGLSSPLRRAGPAGRAGTRRVGPGRTRPASRHLRPSSDSPVLTAEAGLFCGRYPARRSVPAVSRECSAVTPDPVDDRGRWLAGELLDRRGHALVVPAAADHVGELGHEVERRAGVGARHAQRRTL